MPDESVPGTEDEYGRPTGYGGDTSPAAVDARLRASTEFAYRRAVKATRTNPNGG